MSYNTWNFLIKYPNCSSCKQQYFGVPKNTNFGLKRIYFNTLQLFVCNMNTFSGDITFRYIKYLKNLRAGPEAACSSVTVCDINQSMLDVGKLRAKRLCHYLTKYSLLTLISSFWSNCKLYHTGNVSDVSHIFFNTY